MTIPAPTIDRIFDGPYLRANLARNGGTRLLVTFDYRKRNRDGFGAVGPSRQFAEAGFDQLMIATQSNDWFINPDTSALEAACRNLRTKYTSAQALGFSMGGFGAFRLSRALRLSHVIAISPQVSIATDVVPFETRYRREARRFNQDLGDMTSLHDAELAGTILCDPFNANDMTHAQMLQVLFPRVRILRLAGGGHPCTRVLRAAGRAGLVQALAMDPATAGAALLRAHRAARPGIASYWSARARAAAPLHPAAAHAAAENATKLAAKAADGVDGDGDSA